MGGVVVVSCSRRYLIDGYRPLQIHAHRAIHSVVCSSSLHTFKEKCVRGRNSITTAMGQRVLKIAIAPALHVSPTSKKRTMTAAYCAEARKPSTCQQSTNQQTCICIPIRGL